MKKLIIAAYHTAAGCRKAAMVCAIVCTAVASEAATFTWTTSSEQYMPSTWGKRAVGDGQSVSEGSTKTITKWSDNGMAFTAAILLSTDNDTWTPSAAEVAVESDSGLVYVAGVDNSLFVKPTDGSKALYYKILVTGTYTDDTGTWTAKGQIGGNGEYVTLTSLSSDELTTGVANSWDISFQGTGPVPEPTSGLMLLLGVGALALRRKQK